MEYGYVRVSSKEQHEDRQVIALTGFGVGPNNLFVDKQSGKDFNRPAYQRMLKRLRKGDLIVIKSIDRLGRNYEEIIAQWKQLTCTRRVDIVVLDMPLLDTRRDRDLLGTFISDLVLQILSFVSQSERDFIRQRQREGIAAARARGVHLGRPSMELSEHQKQMVAEYRDKKRTARESAELLNVSLRTFYNYAKRCL